MHSPTTFTRRLAGAFIALGLAACQMQSQPIQPQSSSNITLSPDGATLAVVNPDLPHVTFVDAQTLQARGSAEVGAEPMGVAFTPDGRTAVVAVARAVVGVGEARSASPAVHRTARAGKLVFVDAATMQLTGSIALSGQPYSVATTSARAFVSLFALGQIAVIDLQSQAVVQRIDVEPFPAGLALTGDSLIVTHFFSGRITLIGLSSLAPERVIEMDRDANISLTVALSPDGQWAYLPQTLSHAATRNLSLETMASSVVNVLDLANFETGQPLKLDANGVAANLPLAAVVSPDGRWLFVASGGTDSVVVFDLASGAPVATVATGPHPRGLALSADGTCLFVHNALAASVSMFAIEYPNVEGATMPRLSPVDENSYGTLPLSPEVLLGKRLFNSAQPPMGNGTISCATCHFDGGHDARTWLGFPDGPRNTPALFGVSQTQPYHWSGDRPALQDVELTIRDIQHGQGFLPGAVTAGETVGRSPELDALAAYMATLTAPPTPFPIDAETQRRGEAAFARWGCATCHRGPAFTDRELHELQTDRIGDAALQRNPRGLAFDTPGLLGVGLSAPYFHDGSSATLRDTLFRSGFHGMGWAMDKQEVEDVVAYMQALPVEGGK